MIYKAKYVIKLFSLGYMLGSFLFMSACWWMAYFGGTASILITINDYGEMIPELFMWIILYPVVIYGFISILKEMF